MHRAQDAHENIIRSSIIAGIKEFVSCLNLFKSQSLSTLTQLHKGSGEGHLPHLSPVDACMRIFLSQMSQLISACSIYGWQEK